MKVYAGQLSPVERKAKVVSSTVPPRKKVSPFFAQGNHAVTQAVQRALMLKKSKSAMFEGLMANRSVVSQSVSSDSSAAARAKYPVPASNHAPLQLLRKDAKKYITQNQLGIPDTYYDVLEYVRNESKPTIHREGLRAAWNIGQEGRFFIPETETPPVITPQMLQMLEILLISMFQGSVSSGLEEELPELSSSAMGGMMSGESSLKMEEEHKMGGSLSGFGHFKTGEAQDIAFGSEGELWDTEEGRKASKTKRRDLFGSLGVGEHVAKGHFLDDKTLLSQAKSGKSNFTFENDQTFLSVVENGRRLLSGSQKKFIEFDAPPSGHGYIRAKDGKIYKVVPKRYRVVRMQGGDFKTAYGVTEETDPMNFASAYYSAELIG